MTPEILAREAATVHDRIRRRLAERRGMLLAHNYQAGNVQAAADRTGDSLELARWAAETDAEVIVFAGVTFMAESAKLLAPEKTVLLPVAEAGCSLADTITADEVRGLRRRYPRAAVVAYVNSTAEVKAEADICCTSANAVQVVNALPHDEIVCVPDRNLAAWVARHTAKRVVAWPGSCCVHDHIRTAHLDEARRRHPDARVLVHPECRPEVCAAADAVLSTSQMVRYVARDDAPAYVIGTEVGMLVRLRQDHPNRAFHPLAESMVCRTMKMTGLGDVLDALERDRHLVDVPRNVASRARRAVAEMLRIR